jgi:glycerate kinase
MTILIAPDSFKDALPAHAVAEAIAEGIRLAAPSAETILFPLADGGEGTLDALRRNWGNLLRETAAHGPRWKTVRASYLAKEMPKAAFIEMAQASGLQLLAPEERDPLHTTTFGTGEMIKDAIEWGARQITLAIGGSATNDCGMGMLEALGWRFLDKNGDKLKPVGKNLEQVERIDDSGVLPPVRAGEISFNVLCDVENPLYGPEGAAHIFARQKGADDATIERLDFGLRHFARVMERHFGKDFSQEKGAGAAGGMGAACLAFLNARLRPGIEAVMELTGFEHKLPKADWVLTGEGRLDGQTLKGKLVHGVAQKAQRHGIPVTAFCGTLDATPKQLETLGLDGAFSLVQRPCSLHEALANTAAGLKTLAYNWMKTVVARRSSP